MGSAERQSKLISSFRMLATYAPATMGLVLLIIGRVEPALRDSFWIGVALIMIALSCFISAAIDPGIISLEQETMLNRMGIAYRPVMGKIANATLGACLFAAVLYLVAA